MDQYERRRQNEIDFYVRSFWTLIDGRIVGFARKDETGKINPNSILNVIENHYHQVRAMFLMAFQEGYPPDSEEREQITPGWLTRYVLDNYENWRNFNCEPEDEVHINHEAIHDDKIPQEL